MAYRADVKTTFDPSRVIRPFYTGGSVSISEDGRVLASCLGEEAQVTDLTNGASLVRVEGDGEALTSLILTPDSSFLIVCSRSISMRIFALQPSENGMEARLLRAFKPHATPVVTLAVDATSSLLATGGADGEVKVWDIRGGYTTHTFHGHSGVISALHFFEVDVDVEKDTKQSRKRKSGDRNSLLSSQTDSSTAGYRLASGGEDGRVRVWNLHTRKAVAALESHVSVIRGLDYSPSQGLLLSASRDKTVCLWEAATWEQRATVPILEVVESAGFLDNGRFFFTGGETARLRVWSTSSGQEITEEQEHGAEMEAILDVLKHPSMPFLVSVRADQTLVMHSTSPLAGVKSNQQIAALPIIRRISGTHDEVIDLAYVGADRNFLALATNLEDIRIISLSGSEESDHESAPSFFGADVALLKGHEDIIITVSVDWSGHWLATGAKDNTAKLWRLDPAHDEFTCVATFTGHAESIGAVALPSAIPPKDSKEFQNPLEYPPKYLITGSQDKTIKRWNIQNNKSPKAVYTRKAHDKDINALATSYSTTTPLFASASQDRTAKIWDAETGEAVGVLRGHKRGVWSVAFAPSDIPALTQSEGGGASTSRGMVLTGSGDKAVRIWSLADYSCLRTFEGHANSVLKVVWLPPPPHGKGRPVVQVASAAGDGLVKVWNAQDGECATTLDNHIDRVWALAVKPQSLSEREKLPREEDMDIEGAEGAEPQLELVSGSADSTLTFWRDTSEATAVAATAQATQRVEQDQELQNHIRANNYREAIVLALQLNHPKRLLELFTAVSSGARQPGSFTGNKDVDEVICSLSDGQLWALVRRVRDWNANGRTHNVAQHVLYAILRLIPKQRLLRLRQRRKGPNKATEDEVVGALAELSTSDKSKESMKDVLDGLKAYTERHYQRLEKSAEERFVLLWALEQMDQLGGDGMVLSNGHVNGDGIGKA